MPVRTRAAGCGTLNHEIRHRGAQLYCRVHQNIYIKSEQYVTIPQLADRIGVTPASVRDWIKRGHIDPPPELQITGEHAYTAPYAERIAALVHGAGCERRHALQEPRENAASGEKGSNYG